MVKFRIALDFDNVLANTSQYVLNKYNQYWGEKVQFEELTEYDLHKTLNATPENIWELFLEAWNDIKSLEPITPYRSRTFYQYCLLNHDLKIVSACGKPIIKEWLDINSFVNDLPIIYSNPGDPKVLDDFDILIDDNPKHVKQMLDLERIGILFHRPWNKYGNDTEQLYNHDNWKFLHSDNFVTIFQFIKMFERINNDQR